MANLSTILKRDTAGRVVATGIADDAVTGAKIADDTISYTKIIPGYGLVPTGTIIAYAKNATPPGGWLQCNGAEISRTTYADLFAVIGETYGDGNNSTTFELPDLRGIFIRGAGSQTIDGTVYNKSFGLVQRDSFQKHRHYGASLSFVGGSGGSKIYMNYAGGGFDRIIYSETDGTKHDDTDPVPRLDVETRPANIALLYCIKY
jgi:hypothetical protein